MSDSIAGRASAVPPALVCSWTDGGRDAAWVHLADVLDLETVPQLLRGPSSVDRMFTRGTSSDQLEIGDLNPAESPIQALVQLAEPDCGS
jgi:hypothetical protein